MYSSPNSRDGSNTVTTVLESAESLDEIFRALSKYKVWDYLNYYLLQSINEEFASDDDELNVMVKQYQRDLTGHILTQKIQTYLDANKHPMATSDSESSADENITSLPPKQKHKLYKKLSAEVKVNITDHSVEYVYDLWHSLADQFRLPQPAMILHSIAEGCICVTWLVPANLVTYVTRMAQETSDMFAKQQILKVMLENHCIYPMETELETKHTLLELESSLSEIKPSLPETEPSPPEIKPSPPETKAPPLETESPPPETKLPLLEPEPPPPETNTPQPLTEPPQLEPKPTPPETKSPLQEIKLSVKPPPLEPEPSPSETESPPLEPKSPSKKFEMATPKRKVCYTEVSV